MPCQLVIGTQWGDEGKGKIIDLLSHDMDHVVRAQGGNNAGHTIIAQGHELKLHLIPSGILHPHAKCYLGAGTTIDPNTLIGEMQDLNELGISLFGRFFISPGAHLIMPYHLLVDKLGSQERIGTTGRGIGPSYADRANRLGLRFADLIRPCFSDKVKELVSIKNEEFKHLPGFTPLQADEIIEEYQTHALYLKPFVYPYEANLIERDLAGDKILIEGAQGALLDLTWGTYPFVTSSSTVSAGVIAGCGLPPNRVQTITGVVKAYCTRVGEGPFPTEVGRDDLFLNHQLHREFGTTTGRKRRIGWLDLPLLKYSTQMNGVTALALTKLDVLDDLDSLKVCTSYEIDGQESHVPPFMTEDFAQVKPVYKELAGWKIPTTETSSYKELPQAAKELIELIENYTKVPVEIVSIGPDRKQTVFKNVQLTNLGALL